MKKSLIAMAVAGVVSAPAFAATSNVDVYGALGISLEDTNGQNVSMQVTDRQSRIGFKGSEDLGGGLKAIWQMEQAISASAGGQDGVGGASFANRNSYVGLSGGFGTVIMGRHDTPYKLTTAGKLDLFADTMGDVNAAGNLASAGCGGATGKSCATQLISTVHDIRPGNALAYMSPDFSGLKVAAAIVAGQDSDADNVDGTSLGVTYENGPLYVAGGWQDVTDTSEAWKIGAGYAFGNFKLGAVYEDVDADGGSTGDRDSWYLNGAFNMGAITLKGQYGQLDNAGSAADGKKYTLGADYALSKRTNAYVLYDSNKSDGSSRLNGWALGMRHSF
jgi:predicted porin